MMGKKISESIRVISSALDAMIWETTRMIQIFHIRRMEVMPAMRAYWIPRLIQREGKLRLLNLPGVTMIRLLQLHGKKYELEVPRLEFIFAQYISHNDNFE